MTAVPQILVVDDSSVVRRMLSLAIERSGAFRVAYAAPTGALALRRLDQGAIDLVLLDIEMPEMDGIEVLKKIRERHPRLPVVMCSALTERGALTTLQALEHGASDYITKPKATTSPEAFESDLVKKLSALLQVAPSAAPAPATTPRKFTPQFRIDVLAIGCSTGGPGALTQIYQSLPTTLPIPILITQHMPPPFTQLLAERMAVNTGHRVQEGADGARLEAGVTYIAPGGRHMTVVRDDRGPRIVLDDGPPEHSCRPAVDVMFRSVATCFGSGVLACVLTGMGFDGTAGARHIVERGGIVFTQTAATCVVPSMPNSVEQSGVADGSVALDDIAEEIVLRLSKSSLGAILRRPPGAA